jgi:dihydrolipoamide dehydrogenase
MDKFDLVVIGGGPAGYAGAMRAIDFGKRVLLIEKDKIGGAGLFNGALWSKTMWEYCNRIYHLREEGVEVKPSMYELNKIANEAVFERKFQMTCHMKLLQKEAEKQLFHYEKGTGSFIDNHTIRIHKADGNERIVTTENVLIATGSRPRYLPHIPIDEKIIVTSNGIHNFERLPESLVILGAGVIGCEFATIFSNLGKTKVFLIDKASRILPFEDEDVANTVARNFEKNGVVIHRGASLVSMETVEGRVRYVLQYNDGHTEEHFVEKALVSVGRVPNVEELNYQAAGLSLNEKGFLNDFDTRTEVSNIYLAGDISSTIALVNVGEREARHAVVLMYGRKIEPLTYANISTIMFLNPEVASVGISEQDAMKRNIPIKVARIDYSCIARAIAMRKTNGFFKIIVSNDEEMRLLGMRAVGEHASSAIQAVALLIYMNKGIDELAHMLHPHPSIIEGIQECVRMLLGKSIYKSSVFKDKLQCYVRNQEECTPITTLR